LRARSPFRQSRLAAANASPMARFVCRALFFGGPFLSALRTAARVISVLTDGIPTERIINFRTSGTTGHPLLLASHPTVAARYLAFHKRALRRFGIELRHGRGQVGVVLVGF